MARKHSDVHSHHIRMIPISGRAVVWGSFWPKPMIGLAHSYVLFRLFSNYMALPYILSMLDVSAWMVLSLNTTFLQRCCVHTTIMYAQHACILSNLSIVSPFIVGSRSCLLCSPSCSPSHAFINRWLLFHRRVFLSLLHRSLHLLICHTLLHTNACQAHSITHRFLSLSFFIYHFIVLFLVNCSC